MTPEVQSRDFITQLLADGRLHVYAGDYSVIIHPSRDGIEPRIETTFVGPALVKT